MKKRNIVLLSITILLLALVVVFSPMKKEGSFTADAPVPVINDLPLQAGLPPAVEAKRQAIYAAALTRDYTTLAHLADPELNYSFGGEFDGGFAAYMKFADEEEEKSAFEIILTLLRLPYAVTANSIKGDIYTWPSVFTVEPSKWTNEDIAMMKSFLTDEQIESYREYGGYIYYRIGIDASGKWIFYLAGD